MNHDRSSAWKHLAVPAFCNFHASREAVVSYVGTPLCHECSSRLEGVIGAGDEEDERARDAA